MIRRAMVVEIMVEEQVWLLFTTKQHNNTYNTHKQAATYERGHKALQQQTVRDPKYNNSNKTTRTRRKTICTLQQRGL
jgi:hypothetical protein